MKSAKLQPQVCGSPGSAVAALRLSVALAHGHHCIDIVTGPEVENAAAAGTQPTLLWEVPGRLREPVPDSELSYD